MDFSGVGQGPKMEAMKRLALRLAASLPLYSDGVAIERKLRQGAPLGCSDALRGRWAWESAGREALAAWRLRGQTELLRSYLDSGLPLLGAYGQQSDESPVELLLQAIASGKVDRSMAASLARANADAHWWMNEGLRCSDAFKALCLCEDPLGVLSGSAAARMNLAAFGKMFARSAQSGFFWGKGEWMYRDLSEALVWAGPCALELAKALLEPRLGRILPAKVSEDMRWDGASEGASWPERLAAHLMGTVWQTGSDAAAPAAPVLEWLSDLPGSEAFSWRRAGVEFAQSAWLGDQKAQPGAFASMVWRCGPEAGSGFMEGLGLSKAAGGISLGSWSHELGLALAALEESRALGQCAGQGQAPKSRPRM